MRLLSWGNYRRVPPLDSAAVRRQVGDSVVDHILDLDNRLTAKARAYAAFWSEDYGCGIVQARRHDAELYASMRDYERQQWRKGLHALWFAPKNKGKGLVCAQDDGLEDAPPVRAVTLRLLCTLAMLTRRSGIRRHRKIRLRAWNERWAGWNSVNLVFWDNHSDGYGWSAQILEFHPWQLRYSLISDGECTM